MRPVGEEGRPDRMAPRHRRGDRPGGFRRSPEFGPPYHDIGEVGPDDNLVPRRSPYRSRPFTRAVSAPNPGAPSATQPLRAGSHTVISIEGSKRSGVRTRAVPGLAPLTGVVMASP